MNQKRFLTADEVFQLFGVNIDALTDLVDSGAVKALKDLGTYKYRAEDFADLVKQGKLSPRTAGELFEVDSKGEMPFLKIKRDDQPPKVDDDISYIELDEEALDEQAQMSRPPHTPIVPEKWFEESDDSVELTNAPDDKAIHDVETDFDFDIDSFLESDTGGERNLRFLDDEDAGIDLDEHDVDSSISDSDVRLEGPVSSPNSRHTPPRKDSASDSDVRLVRTDRSESKNDSDSDVTIAPSAIKPDSDSDVTLAMPASHGSGIAVPANEMGAPHSDSDVILVGTPVENVPESNSGHLSGHSRSGDSDSDVILVAPAVGSIKQLESDSDVRIDQSPDDILASGADEQQPSSNHTVAEDHGNEFLESIYEPGSDESNVLNEFDQTIIGTHDSGIRFESGDSGVVLENIDLDVLEDVTTGDSGIRLEKTSESGISLEGSGLKLEGSDFDFDGSKTEPDVPAMSESELTLITPEPENEFSFDFGDVDSGITLDSAKTDSEIAVQQAEEDSGISLDFGDGESGITLESDRTDSEMTVQYAAEDDDSGFTLEADNADSGITLDSAGMESGISLEADKTDSEIAIAADSGISLDDASLDSGLALHSTKTDSEIASGFLHGDSGISLDFALADSGLALQGDSTLGKNKFDAADSGIRLSEPADSGISFEDEDPSATLAEIDSTKFYDPKDSSLTQTLNLSDGTDADSRGDHTIEMDIDDSDEELSEAAATVVNKGRSKSRSLSESFDLDEPMEVEDLDISEDLDSAVESDYDEEFSEAEEEVLEASDDDFGAGGISEAEESEDSLSEASVPAVKVRALPKEPSWGLLAVIPIGMASLAMAAAVMVLWGGVATMWTGGEAPGPAAALISTLAGMSPY